MRDMGKQALDFVWAILKIMPVILVDMDIKVNLA